jgi:hypothetical protein
VKLLVICRLKAVSVKVHRGVCYLIVLRSCNPIWKAKIVLIGCSVSTPLAS